MPIFRAHNRLTRWGRRTPQHRLLLGKLPQASIRVIGKNDPLHPLNTHGSCERVARERAARMGATLRRQIESGAKTPEVFSGVERPEGEHLSRERSRPRQREGGAQARDSKGNYRPRPRFCRPTARRSPRGKPPGAAPSGGGGTPPWGELNGGVRFGECQSALPPPTLNKRVRGIGGGVKTPPRQYARQTPACHGVARQREDGRAAHLQRPRSRPTHAYRTPSPISSFISHHSSSIIFPSPRLTFGTSGVTFLLVLFKQTPHPLSGAAQTTAVGSWKIGQRR